MNRSDLEQLFSLQGVDERLQILRQKLAELNETSGAKALAETLKLARLNQKALSVQLQEATQLRDELEEKSKALLTKARNIQAKERSGAISHRDLVTSETEISHLEAQRSELEDQELGVLSRLEDLESEIGKIGEEISEIERVLTDRKSNNELVAAEMQSEIGSLELQRSLEVSKIPIKLLQIYDGIHSRVGSQTIARIEHSNCGGCRLKLSSVEIDKVKRELAQEFLLPPTCEQCGRILFI